MEEEQKSNNTPSTDSLFFVEQDNPNRYRIQSSQLEQIGERLRGKPRLSIFNSIILPVSVTIITLIFSSVFQYVSWRNSVTLQNATDTAKLASETYEKAAAAIGKRIYASLVFVPVIRDLVAIKTRDAARTEAQIDPIANSPNRHSNTAIENLSALFNFDQLKARRYNAYYDQLRLWNEEYDHLLTDIDYALDRPVFIQAETSSEGASVFIDAMKKIDCPLRLTSQLEKLKLNKNSLKLQFAGINHCLVQTHAMLDARLTKALLDRTTRFDPEIEKALKDYLGHVKTMGNEFRCYALRRIDYYNRQKRQSILSPYLIWGRLTHAARTAANEHFDQTAIRCAPDKRAA